jgi:hypothetical protein
MVAYGRFTLAIGVDKGVYTQKAGLSLVATPPKISHTGRHCVGWHVVVCYGAPEWFRPPEVPRLFMYGNLYPKCCAQQTGMHIVVVEALLIVCLPVERVDTYTYKGGAVATLSPLATHSAGTKPAGPPAP